MMHFLFASFVFVLLKLRNHMKLTSFAVVSHWQLTREVLFHSTSFCRPTQSQKQVKFADLIGNGFMELMKLDLNTRKLTPSPLQWHSLVCCLDFVTLFASVRGSPEYGAVVQATC